MQLIIPDCCLGEFCPGIHVDGHRKREDGTYYSSDEYDGKAFHYHNTDGSVFYRYPDGSEYYRRKNGNIQIRPAPDPPSEEQEEVATATTTADPATVLPVDRGPTHNKPAVPPWYDWPPQLNLSVGTCGSFVTIRDASGSTITFEPVGNTATVGDPAGFGFTPARDSNHSGLLQSNKGGFQPTQGTTFVQEWVKKQTLGDVLSQG